MWGYPLYISPSRKQFFVAEVSLHEFITIDDWFCFMWSKLFILSYEVQKLFLNHLSIRKRFIKFILLETWANFSGMWFFKFLIPFFRKKRKKKKKKRLTWKLCGNAGFATATEPKLWGFNIFKKNLRKELGWTWKYGRVW